MQFYGARFGEPESSRRQCRTGKAKARQAVVCLAILPGMQGEHVDIRQYRAGKCHCWNKAVQDAVLRGLSEQGNANYLVALTA